MLAIVVGSAEHPGAPLELPASAPALLWLPLLLCQCRDLGPEVPSVAMLAAVLIRLGQGRLLRPD